ncbi:MAG: hypothetical protein NZ890_17635 [Myxococcota bacterium]|nr:hypothetical protein [Myxococcota bacterium]
MGCAMGETCCDGKCVNLLNDSANCGMCGKKCPELFGMTLPCLFGFCLNFGGDMGLPMPPDGFPGDM